MTYKYAIVRPPGNSYKNAISSMNENDFIDVEKAKWQHRKYCEVLQKNGLSLIELPPDEIYPDGCFVQDPCVIIGNIALITKQKAASRRGEGKAIQNVINNFKRIVAMQSGYMDGGDVMVTPSKIFIGVSKRTNMTAIKQYEKIVGNEKAIIPVHVDTYLHLLTSITFLGKNTMIASELVDISPFKGFDIIIVAKENEYAANCLAIGNTIIMPQGYKTIAKKIADNGFNIVEVEMSEFKKTDGGVTCLSLPF